MIEITTQTQMTGLENGNQILGTFPEMIRSKICFDGEDNILYCASDVSLVDTNLNFRGSNSIIFLEKSKFPYQLDVVIEKNCALYMGIDNYMNGPLHVVVVENHHCVIGNQNAFSFQIWMRTSDAHLVYDGESMKRINPAKSIFIGDHVWIGQSAMILKGTQIDSGSVIGAMSVVANKKIACNTSWAGNPCREIKKGIFWDRACTNAWKKKRSDLSMDYQEYHKTYLAEHPIDRWKYKYEDKVCVDYEQINTELLKRNGAREKYEYLMQLRENQNKNRFVHQKTEAKKKGLFSGWK